jgi:hypothetical protein
MRLLVGALGALMVAQTAYAADFDMGSLEQELREYAVNIFRSPKQSWPGYGIYLGSGSVITAAHVVGDANWGNPSVLIGGATLEAKILKHGDFEGVDISLLTVDERRIPAHIGLRRMTLCETPPTPGQDVVVVTPEGAAHSRIMPPALLPIDVRARFSTAIFDAAPTGNSGSGVFDTAQGCLMGIMSRKIQVNMSSLKDGRRVQGLVNYAKYFVPAAQILQFMRAK